MDIQQIATRRLAAQHLIDRSLPDAEAVVQHFMCVQAQDYAGAKWALAQRTTGTTEADIDKLFDTGKLLRLHMLRPTWHFVHAQDVRWILQLTAPRAHQVNAYYYRKNELTPEIFEKSIQVLRSVLAGHNYKTRAELKAELEAAGIHIADLRAQYILMYAEYEGVICSGPRRGKQHTFALLEERVPEPGRQLKGDEALATFVRRYFAAHGPAQIQDLSWWASLTAAQIKRGIELVGDLQSTQADGKTFWYVPSGEPKITSPLVRLLPNYDELTVAFKDHSSSTDVTRINSAKPSEREFVFYYHVITVDGRAIGGWTLDKNKQVRLRLIGKLSAAENKGVAAELERMSEFYGTKVTFAP